MVAKRFLGLLSSFNYFDEITKVKKLKDIEGDCPPSSPLSRRRGSSR
jgi:hypothetical protein